MVELKGKQLLVATIISLLFLGILSYNALPEAYCPLEDKTVKYIHMSASQKTVTKVVPGGSNDNEFQVLDDRCQKGRTIGQWIPIDVKLIEEKPTCPEVIVIGYTENAKYFCDGIGVDVTCIEDNTIEMPFG